ncbi:MAG: hypothetical protein SPE01_12910, partial [Candidatus Spyradocola sp.]|nr:hypothetical protein [Candidatus Spyradocola sp.]
ANVFQEFHPMGAVLAIMFRASFPRGALPRLSVFRSFIVPHMRQNAIAICCGADALLMDFPCKIGRMTV